MASACHILVISSIVLAFKQYLNEYTYLDIVAYFNLAYLLLSVCLDTAASNLHHQAAVYGYHFGPDFDANNSTSLDYFRAAQFYPRSAGRSLSFEPEYRN